jgi:CubicO group peptidase (beta-lactamase class C family)
LPGCGALRSTLHDLLIYLRANMSPDSTALGHAMALSHQPRFTIREPTKQYPDKLEIGLAWFTTTDGDITILWHDGMTGGYASMLAFTPDKKWGVVVLGNQATGEIDKFGFNLLHDLIDNKLLVKEAGTPMGEAAPKER